MRTLNLKGISCLAAILLFFQIFSKAQVSNVSIGTEAIKDKAILWLKSNGNQGILLPVITNRTNFSGLNNSDDKGMLIYDASDNKVYFWNGSQWVEAGGGAGGGGAQTLTLSGNTFTLSGSPASNVNISTSPPASGQALVWNGTQWLATSLAGDVTGSQGSTVVSGLKGKAIPNLPSTTNALVYDGTAWTFQALSSTGEANTASNVGTGGQGVFKQKSALNLEFYKINAGSNKVSVSLDGANNEIDVDVNSLNLTVAAAQVTGLGTLATLSAITSAQITDGSITSADILDGEIKNADIADGAVTGSKILITGASTGQVMKFNGSTWTAQADDVGGGATPTLANGQLLTGNGTSNSASTITGDIALSGAAMTIKTNVVTTGMIQALAVDGTKLADNSVNSAKIADGTIATADILDATISSLDIANGAVATIDLLDGAVTGAKIATTGATSGQVLKYNGTTWLPQDDNTGSGFSTANEVPRGNGTTLVSSNIYSDGSNIGIGTNAPRSVLELMDGNLILSGSAGSPNDPVDIDFKTHTLTDLFKAKIWTDPATNTLWFSTSTGSPFRKDITIDPNGNVGINQTTPGAKLDVAGEIRSTGSSANGVYGAIDNSNQNFAGVQGSNSVASGIGVKGYHSAGSGTAFGVYGYSASSNGGRGVYGQADGVGSIGIAGYSNGGHAIEGTAAGGGLAGYFQGQVQLTNGSELRTYGTSGVGYARLYHSGSGGNVHLDAYSVGGTYINWFAGSGVNIGNGASGYGPIFASAFTIASSRRFKKEIVNTKYGLADVLKLQGKEYKYITDSTNRNEIGFVAEEVESVIPEVVIKSQEGAIQGLDYGKFSPMLVEAIKEQQSQIEALKKALDKVTNEKQVLQSENELLESKVNNIQQNVEEIKRILSLHATKN